MINLWNLTASLHTVIMKCRYAFSLLLCSFSYFMKNKHMSVGLWIPHCNGGHCFVFFGSFLLTTQSGVAVWMRPPLDQQWSDHWVLDAGRQVLHPSVTSLFHSLVPNFSPCTLCVCTLLSVCVCVTRWMNTVSTEVLQPQISPESLMQVTEAIRLIRKEEEGLN